MLQLCKSFRHILKSSEFRLDKVFHPQAADAAAKQAGGGLLSSFVRSLGVSVVGTGALTRDDIAPALEALKRKLMERNVAAQIADKCALRDVFLRRSRRLHVSPTRPAGSSSLGFVQAAEMSQASLGLLQRES